MTERERYIKTLAFESVDRLPVWHAYGLMPGVLDSWHAEGLPETVQNKEDVRRYFGFGWNPSPLPLRLGPIPAFETKVVEETAEYRIAIDAWGRKTKLLKAVTTLPLATEFPVSDWDSWRTIKARLETTPDRIGDDIGKTVEENLYAGQINRFGAMGFYWFPRDLMGDLNLSVAYYEQADLIHDINETWCSLIEYVLTGAIERIPIDEIHFAEDMAYRNASMIGPGIFDEFMRPYYERIRAIVNRFDVPIFSVDTDGCTNELIHWFRDCGINLSGPNEVQAGNDIVAYRQEFGTSMAYFGGLDKRVLAKGRDSIGAMLEGAVPPMMKSGGGWVVSLDHRVVPGTKLAHFIYYLDRVAELTTF